MGKSHRNFGRTCRNYTDISSSSSNNVGGLVGYANSASCQPHYGVNPKMMQENTDSFSVPEPTHEGMTTKTNKQNLDEYRKHLNKLIEQYTEPYHLPQLTGAEKQNAWAKDIRIRFIEKLDKHQSELSDGEMTAVSQYIQQMTESRYWIDKKTMTWQEHVIRAKIQANSQETPNNPDTNENIVIIDTRKSDIISVIAPKSPKITELLQTNSFLQNGTTWQKQIPTSDTGRPGFIDTLSLALLSAGYTMKILADEPKEPYHEARLFVDEHQRLCLETSVQHIWKAASAIGTRRIWLDSADSTAIHLLLKNYDISVSDDAKQQLEPT